MEVLQEQFNVSVDEPLLAVAEHRSTLQAKSRMLIANEAFEEDGSIVGLELGTVEKEGAALGAQLFIMHDFSFICSWSPR